MIWDGEESESTLILELYQISGSLFKENVEILTHTRDS